MPVWKVFSNKVRRLIRQVYGFRDLEYFELKICQLPEIDTEKNNITLCRKPSKKFVCVRIAAEEQPVSAAGNTAENANDVRKPEKSEKNAVSSLIISKRVV